MIRVTNVAHNEMNMNMGDGSPREAAVAAARTKAVVLQVVQLPEGSADFPELSKFLIAQIQQVSDMPARRYQEMQPGACIGEVIMERNPVLRPDLDGRRRWLGAEHAYPLSLEALHLLALLCVPGIAEVVEAQRRLSRSSRMKV